MSKNKNIYLKVLSAVYSPPVWSTEPEFPGVSHEVCRCERKHQSGYTGRLATVWVYVALVLLNQ